MYLRHVTLDGRCKASHPTFVRPQWDTQATRPKAVRPGLYIWIGLCRFVLCAAGELVHPIIRQCALTLDVVATIAAVLGHHVPPDPVSLGIFPPYMICIHMTIPCRPAPE